MSMENIIKSMINGNNRYQWEILQENEEVELERKFPKYPLLILTCMDPRIDVHRIFQLKPGDAFVLRNAGNQYTEDVLRSILLAVHEYDIKFIVILGHLDCCMKKIHLDQMRYKLSAPALKQIGQYSTSYQFALQRFFKPFSDEIANITNQVDRIKMKKGIPSDINVIGMLFDPETGWVFTEDEFKKFTSYRIFMLNYQKLLKKKRFEHIDFLEKIESEIVGVEITESSEIVEMLENESILDENNEKNDEINLKTELVREIENKDLTQILEKNANMIKKSMSFLTKVQIPKIYVPKIKVYIPKVKINNRKD